MHVLVLQLGRFYPSQRYEFRHFRNLGKLSLGGKGQSPYYSGPGDSEQANRSRRFQILVVSDPQAHFKRSKRLDSKSSLLDKK